MASNFFNRIEEITKTSELGAFIEMFNRHKTNGGVKRHIKDALLDPELPHDLAWWQKNEVLYLSQKEVALTNPAQLAVHARVAFELAVADKRLGFRSNNALKGISISFGPGVQEQVENQINSASRDKYVSTRFVIGEKVTQPLQGWLSRNKEKIVDQAKKYPDTKLYVDRLPENGEDFSIRIHSRKAILDDLYKNQLRTTRDLPAPEKASFKKRIRP